MIETYTAIDFETAQWNPTSICQIGLVQMRHGEILHSINQLIRPPGNQYFYKNIEVHGIQPEDTENAPTFDEVWPEVLPYIQNQVVVAHNSSFDFTCLAKTLDYYGVEQPVFDGHCTKRIFRRGLAYLCKKYKIELNHHDALSDAHACGVLFQRHLRLQALPRTGSLFD